MWRLAPFLLRFLVASFSSSLVFLLPIAFGAICGVMFHPSRNSRKGSGSKPMSVLKGPDFATNDEAVEMLSGRR